MIRVELMSDPVAVDVDGDRVTVKREASGHLIRILFWENRAIDVDRALTGFHQAGIRVSAKKESFLNDARSALRDLGSVKTRITTVKKVDGRPVVPAWYQLRTDDLEVDALDFIGPAETATDLLGPYREDLLRAPERVSDEFLEHLDTWIAAHRLWGANPGVDINEFAAARGAYEEYSAKYQDLVAAIVVNYAARFWRNGSQLELSRALNYFDPLREINSDTWALGFRLAASADGWKVQLESLKQRLLEATQDGTEDLQSVVKRAENRELDFILVPRDGTRLVEPLGFQTPPIDVPARESLDHQNTPPVGQTRAFPSTPSADGEGHAGLLQAATFLGIADHTALALESSNVTPVQCCNDVVRTLKFSGIMANKWVLRPDSYQAFEGLLTELDRHGEEGLVRLMIVDPDGPSAPVLRRRGLLTDRELKSLPVLQDLLKRHPSFKIRMYDSLPIFRLIIVDNTYVTVAPYLNLPTALPKDGWEVPQLALTPNAPYPLSQAFVTFFDEAWARSRKNL